MLFLLKLSGKDEKQVEIGCCRYQGDSEEESIFSGILRTIGSFDVCSCVHLLSRLQ